MSGRKTKIKARSLLDCEIEKISLVSRPASRVPFSFTKSEDSDQKGETMFDMLFKSTTAPAAAAAITGVILASEPTDLVKSALKDLGVSTDTIQKSEDDSVFVLPQDSSVPLSDTMVIKMSDHLAVSVPFIKMAGSFAESCAHRGIYPSVSIATELLHEEIHKSIHKSSSPSEAADRAQALTNDFGGYIATLLKGLPEQVFKMEESQALADAFAGEAPKPSEEAEGEVSKEEGGEPETSESTEAPEGTAEEGVEKAEGEQSEAPEGEQQEQSGEKPEQPEPAPAIDQNALADAIAKSVAAAVKPMADQLGAISDRLEKAEETAANAKKQVDNSIFGSAFSADDREEGVSKSEGDYIPCIDTAFSRG